MKWVKRGKKSYRVLLLCALFVALMLAAPVQAKTQTSSGKTETKKKTYEAKWVTKKGKKYYQKKNGKYAVGGNKIDGVRYVFSEKGVLFTPKGTEIVMIKGKSYCVTTGGKAVSGWILLDNNLYYAVKKGALLTNTTYQGITFTKNGGAKKDAAALQKMKFMEVYQSITNPGMSQYAKLRACWNYVTGGRLWYASKYPNLNQAGWQRATAYNMLTTRCGNCYGFACAFAALAAEAGYHPYVVCGRVSGSRDGAADGMTRHAWVRINGCYYDPEAQYAGWMRGVYGYGYYPISHQVQRTVDFGNY